jgi:cysteine-rich repeat protein
VRSIAVALVIGLCACAAQTDPREGAVTISSEIVHCPVITDVTVAPLEVIIDGLITVSANASFGEPLWRATAGSFDDAFASTTTYHCLAPGDQVLTFGASDSPECKDEVDVPVKCSFSPSCGDGKLDLNHGEQCDDGNTERDDGCSPHCALEVD